VNQRKVKIYFTDSVRLHVISAIDTRGYDIEVSAPSVSVVLRRNNTEFHPMKKETISKIKAMVVLDKGTMDKSLVFINYTF
jgi:hypothetical protein